MTLTVDCTPDIIFGVLVGTVGVVDHLCISLLVRAPCAVGNACEEDGVGNVLPRCFVHNGIHLLLLDDTDVAVGCRLLGRNATQDLQRA